MKPQELRIENFVTFFDSESCEPMLTISGILDDCVYITWSFDGIDEIETADVSYDDIKPIPLTEEWLIKFGWKKFDKEFLEQSEHYELITEHGEYNLELRQDNVKYISGDNYHDGEFDMIITVDYVHQLQNLYFALTGKELKQQ